MFKKVRRWWRERKEINEIVKRDIRHFKRRQAVLRERSQRIGTVTAKGRERGKVLQPLLEELPRELEKSNPNVAKIKQCELLLSERITDIKRALNEAEKARKTAKKIFYPTTIIEMSKEAAKEMIEQNQEILDSIQRWKKETGQEWKFK